MFDHCPGVTSIKTPTLTIKKCPQCGEEVEIFSNEVKSACTECGFVIYNDTLTCIEWCKYAKECVGEEMYNMFAKKKEA
ncbi:MAG TPA: hypothetical protein VN372_12330 [Methanospirillum sp.]|nr:hypothetical protein [Methanospirillum sp.]